MRRLTRRASARAIGLEAHGYAVLKRLRSPQVLQAYINAIPINHERAGDTCYTVNDVLRYRRAHCIEAALVAACALWIQGDPPLLFDLRARDDWDHVVALFRRNGYWGAISKSNHVQLRGRDPIYRSLRELAMSYFHEYHNTRGERSLREYSQAFDLRSVEPRHWISGDAGAWEIEQRIDCTRHYALFPATQARYVTRIDAMEWRAKRLVEYPQRLRRAS